MNQIELMCCESAIVQLIKLNSCDVNPSIVSWSRFDRISTVVEVESELKKVVLVAKLQGPTDGAARCGSAWPRQAAARMPRFFCA